MGMDQPLRGLYVETHGGGLRNWMRGRRGKRCTQTHGVATLDPHNQLVIIEICTWGRVNEGKSWRRGRKV